MSGRALRSWLFVPGDSDKKLAKADQTGADALILDLEDAVAPARKEAARDMVRAFLGERPKPARRAEIWVRINPLDTPLALGDLAATLPGAPDGIMLPKAECPADVARLSHYLDALETACGAELGGARILPLVTETPGAPFSVGDYRLEPSPRLFGLTWGAEDLSAALGASTNRTPGGAWADVYRTVRAMTLLAAHAAGVEAIDTLYADFKDEEGLRASSRAARAEGFSGRLAIHPAQVGPINESFTPSAEEAEWAERIVAAFEAQPEAGAVSLDGRMLDAPHLKQARRTLSIYRAAQT